jgi:hypothetical protein
MVVHICNPSTKEAEAGGSQVPARCWNQKEKTFKKVYFSKVFM